MQSQKYTQNQGFTLLETIVVIVIVFIMIGIAIPAGRNTIDHMRIKTTADQIKSVLKVAQSKAMADPQIHCGVYLFPGTGSSSSYAKKEYAIFFDMNNNSVYNSGVDNFYLGTRSLPPGITLTIPSTGGITDNVVVFRGDGSAKFGGSVVLVSAMGRRDSIHILPSTGRIKTFLKK